MKDTFALNNDLTNKITRKYRVFVFTHHVVCRGRVGHVVMENIGDKGMEYIKINFCPVCKSKMVVIIRRSK